MIYAVTSTPGTGQIEGVYQVGEESVAAYEALGALFFETEPDIENKYRVGDDLVPRPTLTDFDKLTILADDEDVATITLPVGTQVQFDGQTYEIAEGDQEFEFAADVAGSYTIKIFPPWPYYDETYTIEATEP